MVARALFRDEAMNADSFCEAIKKSQSYFSIPRMFLSMAGHDHELRMKVLEFIDVLPALRSSEEIYDHFNMLITPCYAELPNVLKIGIQLLKIGALQRIGVFFMKWLIYNKLAPYFIVANEKKLLSLKKKYEKEGAHVSVDFLGELVISESEAKHFFECYCSAIEKYGGKEKLFHISVKLSSLYSFFGPENSKETKRHVSSYLVRILRLARKHNSFVTIDAEQHIFRHLVEDIFCDVISQKEFRDLKNIGIALQVYRKDAMFSAEKLVEVARLRNTPFTIRLVKGAYWDTEIALSEQNNWPVPLFIKKGDTDQNFEKVFDFLVRHWGTIYVSPATHNPNSIAYAYNRARELGVLLDTSFMFQVLYGLGESVRKALCAQQLLVLVYTPVGDLTQGMAYFARRILENTSNEGFLFQLLGKE